VNRLKFRENWPLWLGIFALALATLAFAITPFSENNYHPDPERVITYSALLAQYSDPISLVLLPVPCIVTVVLLANLIFMPRFRPKKLTCIALILVIVADVWGIITFAGTFFRDSSTLRHMQDITFEDHQYHLTYSLSVQGGWDVSIDSFMVFKCDPTGETCHFVQEVGQYAYDPPEREATFVVDPIDNMLYVQVADKFETVRTCISCADE
jgi:hypothetical protein